jgi:hypothetical protein
MWLNERRIVYRRSLNDNNNNNSNNNRITTCRIIRQPIHQLFRVLCYIVIFIAVTKDSIIGASNYNYNYSNNNNNNNNNNADTTEEEKRIHDAIVNDWYDVIRYLVGLVLCISGLIGLYFHQFASYYFLKQYINPKKIEQRIGRVVSCEPLVRHTSETVKSIKKNNKSKNKDTKISRILPMEGNNSIDDKYYQEETLERQQQQQQQKQSQQVLIKGGGGQQQQQHTEYRILIVYSVPKMRLVSLLCCDPIIDDELAIRCANSFSLHDDVSAETNSSRLGRATIAIDTYRSKSLPIYDEFNNYNYNNNNNNNNGRSGNNSDSNINNSNNNNNNNNYSYIIQSGDETEYFQWFHTNTPRPVDANINLILLKGRPTSACTPELIESHLAQVGTTGKDECQTVSLLGMTLVFAIIVLLVVSVFEILSMPNPETQRPIGFTILTGIVIGSVVGSYIFAELLFEQYKQKVFLSAFVIPSTIATATTTNNNNTSTTGGIIKNVYSKSSLGGISSIESSSKPTTKMTNNDNIRRNDEFVEMV